MPSALDVANAIRAGIDYEAGEAITPLKLQKLLYYVQAWSLAIDGKPAFDDEIQAWAHGPVVPAVWHAFKDYRWEALPPVGPEDAPEFDKDLTATIATVIDAYGSLSAKALENMTHAELPWREARGDLPPEARSKTPISLQTMQSYYDDLLAQHERGAF